jgi:MacB-like periplasmic core domain
MEPNVTRQPPRLALLLMKFWLSSPSYEAVAGDLFEEYQDPQRTTSWFWRQTFSTVRPNWVGPIWNAVAPMIHVPASLSANLRQDVAYALRTLRRSPGFALVVVVAIALGIGVNTAIFTVLNSVAFRPVQARDADRVIAIYQIFGGEVSRHVYGEDTFFSYPELRRYRAENQVLSGLTAYAEVKATMTDQTGHMVPGQMVDCNYFTVLDRPPVLGRDSQQRNAQGTVLRRLSC